MRSNVLRFVIVIIALLAVCFSQGALSATCPGFNTIKNNNVKPSANTVWKVTFDFPNDPKVTILKVMDNVGTSTCASYSCNDPPTLTLTSLTNNKNYYVEFKVGDCTYKMKVYYQGTLKVEEWGEGTPLTGYTCTATKTCTPGQVQPQ